MESFVLDETPTAEVEHREAATQPLVDAVRELVDATIRTTVPEEEIALATKEVQAALARLRTSQLDGPAGVHYNAEGRAWNWGNAVVGQRNAIAPPLEIVHDEPGRCHAEVTLGAAYEGPPGLVHGGVAALLLDQVMGETASHGFSRVSMTGTLTLRHRKGTQLGPVRIESHIEREEGRKIFVVATIADTDGVSIEADGIFIVPRWASPVEGWDESAQGF